MSVSVALRYRWLKVSGVEAIMKHLHHSTKTAICEEFASVLFAVQVSIRISLHVACNVHQS